MTDRDPTDQFEDVAEVAALLGQWMDTTRAPRSALDLLELVDRYVPRDGGCGADLGAYSGAWAEQISERYGLSMIAVDVALSPLKARVGTPLPPLNASLVELPLRNASLDFVWCRDTLSMEADVGSSIAEMARVLRPGGSALVYSAVTTPSLEPLERAELFEALAMPAWWGEGRRPIEDALAAAGLVVMHAETLSPEIQESAALARDPELCRNLAVLGRSTRERVSMDAALSPIWARRFRAWAAWAVYLLLGKLETVAWVARRP